MCNYFTDSELTNLSFSVIHTLRKKPEISKISSEPPKEILQNAYDNTQSNEQTWMYSSDNVRSNSIEMTAGGRPLYNINIETLIEH